MALVPSDGWAYYRQIDITDAGNISGDYQMKLTIHKGDGDDVPATGTIYCDNLCLDFHDDIRFGTTNDPATAIQLKQWVESSDANTIVLWVKCPTDGSNTFYMFIGRATTDEFSDGDNTFIFFDDFPGSSLDASKWDTILSGDGAITVANSKVRFTCTEQPGDNYAHMHTDNQIMNAPCALRILGLDVDAIGNQQIHLNPSDVRNNYDDHVRFTVYDLTLGGGGNSDVYADIRYGAGPTSEEIFRDENVGATYDKDDIDIILKNDRTVQVLIEGVDKGTSTGSVDDETWRVRMAAYERGNSDFYIDTIFLRKYNDTEPSWDTFGAWTSLVVRVPRPTAAVGNPYMF